LWQEGSKVQSQWFYRFLKDVVPLRPQLRVRMPSFSFAPGEAEAVADYFAWKGVQEWPATFTRRLRLARGLSQHALADAVELPRQTVAAIENGARAETEASFDRILRYAESVSFRMEPAVDPNYEARVLRSHAYLARRGAEEPDHLATGERIATEAVNCFQCHFRLGTPPPADPIAWAPDLAGVHERLREDWVARWLRDPARVYPGTSMPANFAGDPPQYQAIYPDSTNDMQLRVVQEWLFNLDRVLLGSGGTE
jgi:transcriptional regulator with XRE-family HTH domain